MFILRSLLVLGAWILRLSLETDIISHPKFLISLRIQNTEGIIPRTFSTSSYFKTTLEESATCFIITSTVLSIITVVLLLLLDAYLDIKSTAYTEAVSTVGKSTPLSNLYDASVVKACLWAAFLMVWGWKKALSKTTFLVCYWWVRKKSVEKILNVTNYYLASSIQYIVAKIQISNFLRVNHELIFEIKFQTSRLWY